MKKVLSILVVVLALTLVLGCFAYADEFGGAGYEEAAFALTEADITTLTGGGDFVIDKEADYKAPDCIHPGFANLHCLADVDAVATYGVDIADETDKGWCYTDKYYYVVIAPNGIHNFLDEVVADTAPTCTATGVGHHICSVCGVSKGDKVVIPMLEHDFGEWITEVEPTCLQPGSAVRICNVCGLREKKTLDPHDHADTADYVLDAVILAPYQDKAAGTCNDGLGRFVCPYCMGKEIGTDAKGDPEFIIDTIPVEHTFGAVIEDTAPTCVDDGLGYHECTVCGIKSYEVAPGDVDADGDGILDGYEILEFLGHSFIYAPAYYTEVAAPTCTAPGYGYYVCERCFAPSGLDATFQSNADNFVALKDYDGLVKNELAPNNLDIAPSSADPAKTDDYQTAIEVEYYAPLGHDFSEWTCVTAPGQEGNINGYWSRTCMRPGCTEVEEFVGTQEEFDAMIEKEEEEAHAGEKNGLVNEDGEWKYYIDDVFQSDFVGMVAQDGNDFFVADGKVCMDANGLNMYDGEWYFLSLGRVCKEHTGLALYDGCWFFITDGKLDTSVTGLVDYNGGTFVFAEGRLIAEYSGLYFDGTDWYFAANGQIQKEFSGSVVYDGETFVLENGKLVG